MTKKTTRVRRGSPDERYFVLEGSVTLRRGTAPLATLGEGTAFGAASLDIDATVRHGSADDARKQLETVFTALLALYGLKWNNFSPELPTEALLTTAALEERQVLLGVSVQDANR